MGVLEIITTDNFKTSMFRRTTKLRAELQNGNSKPLQTLGLEFATAGRISSPPQDQGSRRRIQHLNAEP